MTDIKTIQADGFTSPEEAEYKALVVGAIDKVWIGLTKAHDYYAPMKPTKGVFFDSDKAIEIADAIYEAAGASKPVAPAEAPEHFNEAALRLAAEHGKRAKFSYDKGDGTLETRRLRPLDLWKTMGGYLMVGGEDADRAQYRNFRVDRIQGTVVIG